MSYNDVTDWLGPSWEDGLGVYNSYLGMNPGLFTAGMEFVEWARNNNKLPTSGTTSDPTIKYISGSDHVATNRGNFYVMPRSNLTNLYDYSLALGQIYTAHKLTSFPSYAIQFYLNNASLSSTFPYTFTVNNNQYTITVDYGIGSNEYYTFSLNNIPMTRVYTSRADSYQLAVTDVNRPIYMTFLDYGNLLCSPIMFSYSYSNGSLISCSYINNSVVKIPYVTSQTSILVTDYGTPQYQFNNTDPIYIDLQLGNLTSAITALANLITALNQNLITYTVALQEAQNQDLPVDTSPFIQLVQSYETVTNDCISGNITVTSALSSMYTLLSNSIINISNPSLENACIDAYNAFLNKIALYQSSQTSSVGNYENVVDFQSDLDSLLNRYNNNLITLQSLLSSAATSLDTYMLSASGLQEVIGLQNAYNLFLNNLGFELNLSSNASDVIDGFNDILDDYLAGDLDRSTALSDLRTGYKNGISGSLTASDVGAITSAYQAALDQIAVKEFDISTDLGEISADTITLEGDLLGEFDYYTYAELFDFEEWQLFSQQESNLYREYFQRILADTSPFYAFVYYPLILGVAGLILGSAITFSSKGKNVRGSSYKPGRSDK